MSVPTRLHGATSQKAAIIRDVVFRSKISNLLLYKFRLGQAGQTSKTTTITAAAAVTTTTTATSASPS
jgi:hypothetical protein